MRKIIIDCDPGIVDDNRTGLLFKLSTASKEDLPKVIIDNRKQ